MTMPVRAMQRLKMSGCQNMKRKLPIGNDNFAEIRELGQYFVDKSLFIRDFLKWEDKVALITRPRRFGKSLNMTMLREFLDITKDSRVLFDGLKIMDTEYADQINSRPVVYYAFKNCKGATAAELLVMMKNELLKEYVRYGELLKGKLDESLYSTRQFCRMAENLMDKESGYPYIATAIQDLCAVLYAHYGKKPILLIDEYDQPIMSSYEYGYHEELSPFFSNLYGSAMKGNDELGQALLTGVQRVAKESIFSQFNNPQVYTVVREEYAPYFGLTKEECARLLTDCGRVLDEEVRKQYDGYMVGGVELYNPWSILNYAKTGFLDNYWVNTSANFLVRQALKNAGRSFWNTFDRLAAREEAEVWLTLDTSYAERASDYSLWGLLVNAGYLTVRRRTSANTAVVKVPNGEVMAEFFRIGLAHHKKKCSLIYEIITPHND